MKDAKRPWSHDPVNIVRTWPWFDWSENQKGWAWYTPNQKRIQPRNWASKHVSQSLLALFLVACGAEFDTAKEEQTNDNIDAGYDSNAGADSQLHLETESGTSGFDSSEDTNRRFDNDASRVGDSSPIEVGQDRNGDAPDASADTSESVIPCYSNECTFYCLNQGKTNSCQGGVCSCI